MTKKIHQPKLDVEQRIKNSERERERVLTYLCGLNIDRMEERKQNIYSKKKNGEKKSQNKRNMKESK